MGNTRQFKSLGIWADNAEKTIPPIPSTIVAYRNEAFPQSENEEGELYNSIPDSANFNQAMFIITSITDTIDRHGTLGWYNLVDYDPLPALVWASDDKFYTALQPSGPGTAAGVRDPADGLEPDYWDELISSNVISLDLSSQDPGDEGARQVGTTFQPDTTDFPAPVSQTVQDTLEFVDERAYKLRNMRLIFAASFDAGGILQGQGYNIKDNIAEIITSQGYTFYRITLEDTRFFVPDTSSTGDMHIEVTPLREISGDKALTSNKFVIAGAWFKGPGVTVIDNTPTIKVNFTDPFNINVQQQVPFSILGWHLD